MYKLVNITYAYHYINPMNISISINLSKERERERDREREELCLISFGKSLVVLNTLSPFKFGEGLNVIH